MHFKLIIALVEDENTEAVMKAAREEGSLGATVISNARGEGIEGAKTFLGLTLESQRNMVIFLVEEHLSRGILETIARAGNFSEPGGGIAFQIDVEDAVGLTQQMEKLAPVVEEKI